MLCPPFKPGAVLGSVAVFPHADFWASSGTREKDGPFFAFGPSRCHSPLELPAAADLSHLPRDTDLGGSPELAGGASSAL